MRTQVKAFNSNGIERYRDFLDELRGNGNTPVPTEYLNDAALTTSLSGYAEVDSSVLFPRRLEAGKYFSEQLTGIDETDLQSTGMWAWLSLLYFDQVCPPLKTGVRKPGKAYGYIPSARYSEYYRHKLLGPFNLYRLHGVFASALLSNPVHVVGEINEQFASRQEIVSNKELMKVIHKLYFDAERGTFKRGATTRKKGGAVDRFWKVQQQLELTYDFYSMTSDEITNILPSEFDIWCNRK